MSYNICTNETITKVISNIYRNIYRNGGWEYVINVYNNRQAKERSSYISDPTLNVEERNLIEFIGSTRKVYIDYIVKKVLEKLSSSDLLQDYKSYLGDRNIVDVVQANAFGSTNPTSDYDLTFAGPGIHYITKCLIQQFDDELFQDSKKLSLAEMFDSNFYVCPDMILYGNKEKLDSLGVTLYQVNEKTSHYAPISSTKEHFDIERNQLFKKKMDHSELNHDTIMAKYKKLLMLNEQLDDELYKLKEGPIMQSSSSFIQHILNMMETSIESYYALSTFMIVVYGMQARRIDELEPLLKEENFRIAGVENCIDLVKHHSHSFNVDNTIETMNLAVKVSKYIQRILLCLKYVSQYSDEINKEELSNLTSLTNDIMHYRSNSSKMSSSEKEQYMEKIKLFMDTFGLNNALTYNTIHPMFKMLDPELLSVNHVGGRKAKKTKRKNKYKKQKKTRKHKSRN